jgi:hypothetical protein
MQEAIGCRDRSVPSGPAASLGILIELVGRVVLAQRPQNGGDIGSRGQGVGVILA